MLYQLNQYQHQNNLQRITNLSKAFYSQFKTYNSAFVSAPGRVNLIGQHIDYQGYGVLPFAINKTCLIAFKQTSSDFIEITHAKLKTQLCNLSKFPPYKSEQNFHKLFYAGYSAGIASLQKKQEIKGMQVMVEGNIPFGSGLSSSSAFVVAVCTMTVWINGQLEKVNKFEMIQRCIEEQFKFGVACGGMDQTVSFFGRQNCCLNIDFCPLRYEIIKLPSFKFIVADSATACLKLQSVGDRYNKRVCECQVSSILLSKRMGLKEDKLLLKQVQEQGVQRGYDIIQFLKKHIQNRPYSFQEIETQLHDTLSSLLKNIPHFSQVLKQNKTFHLYNRSLHVFTQAQRVKNFVQLASHPHSNQHGKQMGRLMNQSHFSCRDLYQCSSVELDQLTAIGRKKGLGARLTGAGWGGYGIIMCEEQNLLQIMGEIREWYKQKNIELRDDLVFITGAQRGTSIILNQ